MIQELQQRSFSTSSLNLKKKLSISKKKKKRVISNDLSSLSIRIITKHNDSSIYLGLINQQLTITYKTISIMHYTKQYL